MSQITLEDANAIIVSAFAKGAEADIRSQTVTAYFAPETGRKFSQDLPKFFS